MTFDIKLVVMYFTKHVIAPVFVIIIFPIYNDYRAEIGYFRILICRYMYTTTWHHEGNLLPHCWAVCIEFTGKLSAA